MKLIVFGTQTTMKRIIPLLSEQDTEVVGMADSLDNLSALPHELGFDMALVDGGLNEINNVYQLINRLWGVPVVFTVGPKPSDWEKLESVDAYAYLPEEAGGAELMARLKAVYRRISRIDSLIETNLAYEEAGQSKQ